MTSPILSISTTEQIGRLYQLPGGGYTSQITGSQAVDGVLRGELFPSITNCIGTLNPSLEGYVAFMYGKALAKGQIQKEAEKAHITYRDATADRGTRVHKAIEDFIEKGFAGDRFDIIVESEMYKGIESYRELQKHTNTYNLLKKSNDIIYFEAFLNFVRAYRPRFISQEATVYGETFSGRKYAGTTDFIAEIDGKVVIGDWKTTSKLKQTVGLQLAAVANAKQITTDFETLEEMPASDGCWGVKLNADGSFEVYEAENHKQAWVNFQAARTLWDMVALEEKIAGGPILKRIA